MMVGFPGTGKSTLIKELKKEMPHLVSVSSDEYIEKLAKEQGKNYNEVYQEAIEPALKWLNQEIQNLIKKKKDFIWDQTNLVSSSRLKKINNLKNNGYDISAIIVELSKEEHNRRLQKRVSEGGKFISEKIIQNMMYLYERPTYNEGFNSIILISDDGFHKEIAVNKNLYNKDKF